MVPSSIAISKFVALATTALALTMESAHVLELAPKMRYSPEMYAAVNGTLYRYFAIGGESTKSARS